MGAETQITARKPVTMLSDREIAEETLEHLRHLRDQLDDFAPLLGTLKAHGLFGLRRVAKLSDRVNGT